MNAKDLIKKLQLKPHPEGGHYAETYRSEKLILSDEDDSRNVCTAIYFLLEDKEKSHFHRIKSDELWFFHHGVSLEIVMIMDDKIASFTLGNDIMHGELPQAMVPANTWFASKLKGGSGYALVSCTVSPGFDFKDFEIAKREELVLKYGHLKNVIIEFTN